MYIARIGPFAPGEATAVLRALRHAAIGISPVPVAAYTWRLDVDYDPDSISETELMDLAEKASQEWERSEQR